MNSERGSNMAAPVKKQNKKIFFELGCVCAILSSYLITVCSGNVTCDPEDHFRSENSAGSCDISETQTCRCDSSAAVNPYVEQWANSRQSRTRLFSHHEQPLGHKPDVHHLNESLLRDLRSWKFSREKLLSKLPLDKEGENFVRNVPGALFSKVAPTPFRTEIKLAAFSQEVLRDILDMHPEITESEFFLAFIAGNTFHPTSEPLAHRYGGHQFGSWSGQLGDGRAHLLGEYVNKNGERWELQLKGSGLTPYSRRGDGRAVIRSSVREFLASEAMHHLGIPTSRAASLVVSDDPVWRDQFYDGHPKKEHAAVVLRIAPSWFRIGSLEILTKNGEFQLLRQLTDFLIDLYFPEAARMAGDDRFLQFYSTVVSSTARMIAQWMSVGFAHGVMNTDNFSILSLTIDYGPFGFLDEYDPSFVPNTSDDEGMYAIGNQATVAHFNLAKLREALLPLLSPEGRERSRAILAQFADDYNSYLMVLFREKLALGEDSETSGYLIALLLKMMEDTASDFTMTFRQLGEIALSDLAAQNIPDSLWALKELQKAGEFPEWAQLYQAQFGHDAGQDRERRRKMNEVWLEGMKFDNEQLSTEIIWAMRNLQSAREFPKWARLYRFGHDAGKDSERIEKMNAVNPRYILRNWMAQSVIEEVENDRFEGLRRLHRILSDPFTEQEEAEGLGYAFQPPSWSQKLRVSCSS